MPPGSQGRLLCALVHPSSCDALCPVFTVQMTGLLCRFVPPVGNLMKGNGPAGVTFFENGVRGVWRVCFHEMPDRSTLIVRWNANATGVHDQLAANKLNHPSNVRVPAQDHWFPDGTEKFHYGVVGPNYWESRTHVFEKIGSVARRCTVTEEHHAVYHS